MAPKSLGLWMLFLWIQESVSADAAKMDCGNDTGILGKTVELKCCYPGKDLKSTLFRVQWQLKGTDDCLVDAYLPGQNVVPQCEHYKNRTKLEKDYLHLQLVNVSLEDSKIYECILQKNENRVYKKIFHGLITLEVAANESLNAPYVESPTSNPSTPDNQQQTQVIAISSLAAAVVIITISILILYKRRHSLHRAYTAPVGVDMS